MSELTQTIEILLDRLYNLKGEDNVLLKEIVSKIEETQKRIEISESNRENSELNRINCEGTLELFLTQKKSFEEAFEGLDNDTFAALRDVNVNLETVLTDVSNLGGLMGVQSSSEGDEIDSIILNSSYSNKTLSVEPTPAKEREFCLTKLGRASKTLPHKQN